ncbi:hypothetical protein Aperf_G00000080623 [Anoplocephala perfoliata]
MAEDLRELGYIERRNPPKCLVLLHIASFGKQGPELGSDESPVAMLTAKLFDIRDQTFSGPEWQTPVRMPCLNALAHPIGGSSEEIDESVGKEAGISEDCRALTGLKFSDICNAPSLWEALESMDTWLKSQGLDDAEDADDLLERNFELVVDGGVGLRLVLHQSLDHPIDKTHRKFPYLCQFIDLKKVFMVLYWKTDIAYTISEMMQSLNLRIPDYQPEAATWTTKSPNSLGGSELLQKNFSPFEKHSKSESLRLGYWPLMYCRAMATLCARMTSDGAQWKLFEKINLFYQPKFVRSTEIVADDVVVRARGLPWQTTDCKVQYFFRGLNIAPGGIALVLSKAGRRNGEAVIRFTIPEQRDLALKKHKHHMDQRYIEIYAAESAEFVAVAGGETQEAEIYLSKFTSPSQSLIRMRGLPYTVSPEAIIEFFAKAGCQVQFNREGILFVNRLDGRATGDAFAMFATDAEAEKALQNHRQHIGSRYIELFRSTPAEVNQVMNAIIKHSNDLRLPLWPAASDQDNYLSQTGPLLDFQSPSVFTDATKDPFFSNSNFATPMPNMSPLTLALPSLLPGSAPSPPLFSTGPILRIKGMPPETTVNDILNFLGTYWPTVALHGIHLIYTATGMPLGEAFVRFVSQQVVQMVLAAKQGQAITNASTGAQSNVQLSLATVADMVDFITIPGLQPSIDWNGSTATVAAAAPATFGATLSPYLLFSSATPLQTHLVMQLRAVTPFTNPTPMTIIPSTNLTITASQSLPTVSTDADTLCQTGIHAGP